MNRVIASAFAFASLSFGIVGISTTAQATEFPCKSSNTSIKVENSSTTAKEKLIASNSCKGETIKTGDQVWKNTCNVCDTSLFGFSKSYTWKLVEGSGIWSDQVGVMTTCGDPRTGGVGGGL